MHIFLQLHITGKCNLRCSHCYIEEHTAELTFRDIKTILSQYNTLIRELEQLANEKATGHIQITGGEPLQHPDFIKILKLLKRKNYRVGIMSNGSLIDKATIKHLKRIKLKFFQVSLDGNETTHDAIRGKGNFVTTLKAISLMKKYDLPVHVSFTANAENYTEFPQLAEICRQHKVDLLWSDRCIPCSNNEINALSKEQTEDYVKILHQEKNNKENHKSGLEIRNQRALQFIGSQDEPYACQAGDCFITVDEHGNFMPCRRMPIICGNFRNTTMTKVFLHHGVFTELRRHRLQGKCVNCEHSQKCRGGAHCMAYALTGSFQMPDPGCFMEESIRNIDKLID